MIISALHFSKSLFDSTNSKPKIASKRAIEIILQDYCVERIVDNRYRRDEKQKCPVVMVYFNRIVAIQRYQVKCVHL